MNNKIIVSFIDVKVISRVCCCSDKLIDAKVKSDYLMQEMQRKMGQTSSFLPFLRHITQI